MTKESKIKFINECVEYGINKEDLYEFLDIYDDEMRPFQTIVDQEKNSLLATYYNFRGEDGEINYSYADAHLEELIEDKGILFKSIINEERINKLHSFEAETLITNIALSYGACPFQWGLGYEDDAVLVVDTIDDLLRDFFEEPTQLQFVQNCLEKYDDMFSLLYFHNRFDYCTDFVKSQANLTGKQINSLIIFITDYPKYIIDKIKETYSEKNLAILKDDSQAVSYNQNGAVASASINTLKPKITYKNFKDILNKNFQNIIGLTELKDEVENIYAESIFTPPTKPYNLLLTGNPGTGKTTGAKLIGKVLYESGFLKNDKIKHITAAELQGEFVGHTIPKIQKIFRENCGGVIFLDEIYSLTTDTAFNEEAVNELLKQLESQENANTLVIAAGYDEKINAFFDANPGLKSRFSNKIKLKNYSIQDLTRIVKIALKEANATCSSKTLAIIEEHLKSKMNEANFGNARDAIKIVKGITQVAANRNWKRYSDEDLKKIPKNHIYLNDVKKYINQDKTNETKKTQLGFVKE